jgi:hypothetical protein
VVRFVGVMLVWIGYTIAAPTIVRRFYLKLAAAEG